MQKFRNSSTYLGMNVVCTTQDNDYMFAGWKNGNF